MANQPLATALALFSDLVVIEQDPNEETKALQEVAYAALRFTPNVVVQNSGLVAEVSASLKLFGGLKKLCQLLIKAVAAQGLQLCAGVAPTAKGGMAAGAIDTTWNRHQWSRQPIKLIARFPACRVAGICPASP